MTMPGPLVEKYDSRLHDDKDLALIEGYLSVRDGKLQDAVDNFTRALKSDPQMATGYVNRGFVYDDLRQPDKAHPGF